MANENGFRSKLFGGFNRKDVAAYIEKLAGERNQYKADAERRMHDAAALSAQNNELSLRLAEAQLIASQSRTQAEEAAAKVKESIDRAEKAEKDAGEAKNAHAQAADKSAAADAKLLQAEEKCTRLETQIADLEAQLAESRSRLTETEALLAAALQRAEEAEALANSRRVIALEEAAETLRALSSECAQSAELTDVAADRANGEFWKVTAALENLSQQVRSAAKQFGAMADNLAGETETK